MKIYVINIDRNKVRRKAIEAQLKKFNVRYEIISAIDHLNMTDKDLYSAVKSNQVYTKIEASRMLSHCRVYYKMQNEKDDHALIIEDDVFIRDRLFKNILDSLQLHIVPKNVILLNYSWEHDDPLILQKKKPLQQIIGMHNDYFMYMPNETHSLKGASAYVISKTIAKDILQLNSPALISYADSWMVYNKFGIISGIDCMHPMPIVHEHRFDTQNQSSAGLFKTLINKMSINRHHILPSENQRIIKVM